jgi:2,3-bisphosphoglycerate-dependent phosphoglycerate mutase
MVESIILSRHGESVESARGIENGDPLRDKGLTETGRAQAQTLGREIAGDVIDLCIASEFPRTQQTAEIALAGRDLSLEVDADLNDIRYGELEGKNRDEYQAWAHTHSITTPLPGGESKVQVASRMCEAMERILKRPERYAFVVTHELLVGHLLNAIHGRTPAQPHDDIAYATPYRLSAEEVHNALCLLRDWIGSQELAG